MLINLIKFYFKYRFIYYFNWERKITTKFC